MQVQWKPSLDNSPRQTYVEINVEVASTPGLAVAHLERDRHLVILV